MPAVVAVSVALGGPPQDFADAHQLAAAGAPDRLWVAVAGQERADDRDLRLRTYELGADGDWKQLGEPVTGITGDGPVVASVSGGAPCVGYDVEAGAAVGCWDGAGWGRPRVFHGSLLLGLRTVRGELHALLLARGRARVMRRHDGRWLRIGRRLDARGVVVALGSGPGAGIEVVTVEQRPRGRIRIHSLRGGRWRRSAPPLRHPGMGPTPSGPVRWAGRVFLPVTVASARNWPFSVYVARGGRWRRAGGGPLNRGPGSAQGTVSLAAGRAWASWQQHAPRPDGGFDTRIYTAELTRAGTVRAPRLLWKGVSIGPGDVGVVEAFGRPFALHMDGIDTGLRAAVTPL